MYPIYETARKKSSEPMTRNLFIEPKDNTGVWRVGTSGWNYPPNTGPGSWTGVFYPLAKTDELRFYSRYFNAVEINSTFYHPCNPKTAEGWAQRTPPDFEFTVNAWQEFTHGKTAVMLRKQLGIPVTAELPTTLRAVFPQISTGT